DYYCLLYYSGAVLF
nr:immunoglobulin light chain junction region [Macaca mulatta]MOW67667.1 immunoglobulin light chain junction region [Macaca mulatta]MOW67977.1 immunoglobulin light chain junction region [Macaca mulatta]MOW68775.1 immunoglobulin light chain junction region [Macaca mulatta]MOW69011.1 immunoglobulin light chain junction region [Macaca mulatta]